MPTNEIPRFGIPINDMSRNDMQNDMQKNGMPRIELPIYDIPGNPPRNPPRNPPMNPPRNVPRNNIPARCYGAISIINTFRKLWEEHSIWTRSFIISNIERIGDLKMVTARLLKNPDDFAAVLTNYYGPDIARKFSSLLKDHLLIAADLVNAAKAGDTAKADLARRKWYQNANDIADFLTRINPYWDKGQWQNLLYEHLRMVENEAVYRLNSQYAADIAEFDRIENQALEMADYMAEGIINQFGLR